MKRLHRGENLIKLLESAGYEARYVGGCVRDLLLERHIGDIDITTNATPEEMKVVFTSQRLLETGLKHGTITVIDDGESYEITTYRTEAGYSDMRHPDKVNFVRTIDEDLARRDFTMNALAMDREGTITDLFGGIADVDRGIIRAIGNPDRRFREDALRIMRAIRFAAVLGFVIEPETREAMMRNRHLLAEISVERIFAELKKLVMGEYSGIAIRQYIDVLEPILPEITRMKGFDQHNSYHKYDVLEHCIRAMEYVEARDRVYIKLAALMHDVGKPDTFFIGEDGQGHMYGHPAAGEKIVREILTRLKADNFTLERVCLLVKYHDLLFKEDKPLLKRWLRKFGPEVLLEILEIKVADNHATGNMSDDLAGRFERIRLMIEKILSEEEAFSLKDLAVSGRDLVEFIAPGPNLGKTLDELLDKVIDGKLPNDREALIDEVRRIYG